jgi:hypothetical protein
VLAPWSKVEAASTKCSFVSGGSFRDSTTVDVSRWKFHYLSWFNRDLKGRFRMSTSESLDTTPDGYKAHAEMSSTQCDTEGFDGWFVVWGCMKLPAVRKKTESSTW